MAAFAHDVIVVPVDFSPASANGIKVALELAGGDVSRLRLVNVMAPLEAISPAAAWGQANDVERAEAIKAFSRAYLEQQGIPEATIDIRHGPLGLEITDYAREKNADLIVISSHGYHGFKRVLLGSVAETILRHAHCAVLVLRRQDAE